MSIINTKETKPYANAFVLVKCNEFSESGYEVCQYRNGNYWSQGNGDSINMYVESWIYLEDIEDIDTN